MDSDFAMRIFYCFAACFVLMALGFSFANASCDPGSLQDHCDPRKVVARDFKFTGLGTPGNTNNSLGFSSIDRWVDEVPGMNTFSIGVSRADFASGGLSPPHYHPRASQAIIVTEGHNVQYCFVTSRENNYKLFCNELKAGDGMVIPKAMVHFAVNYGKQPAVVYLSYDSQNPGNVAVAESSFGTNPPIEPYILEKAFKMRESMVRTVQKRVRADPSPL
ncbi:hypothetical protein ACFE04_014502 [Oxalis oulophora]